MALAHWLGTDQNADAPWAGISRKTANGALIFFADVDSTGLHNNKTLLELLISPVYKPL